MAQTQDEIRKLYGALTTCFQSIDHSGGVGHVDGRQRIGDLNPDRESPELLEFAIEGFKLRCAHTPYIGTDTLVL